MQTFLDSNDAAKVKLLVNIIQKQNILTYVSLDNFKVNHKKEILQSQ